MSRLFDLPYYSILIANQSPDDEDADSIAPSSIMSQCVHNSASYSSRSAANARTNKGVKFDTASVRRAAAQPQAQNWLARFLRVKPAVKLLGINVNKVRAGREVRSILRGWKSHGMTGITTDRITGNIYARVDEANSKLQVSQRLLFKTDNYSAFSYKPVSVAIELFAVQYRGTRKKVCAARVSQVQGAKSTFETVAAGLMDFLRARELLMEDRETMKQIRICLEQWESDMD